MSLDAHIVYECKVTLFIHYTHKWELIITCHIGIMSSPLMLALFACRVLVILTVGISVTCLNTHKTCCLWACLRVMVCSRGFLDGHFCGQQQHIVCAYLCTPRLFLLLWNFVPAWSQAMPGVDACAYSRIDVCEFANAHVRSYGSCSLFSRESGICVLLVSRFKKEFFASLW